MASITTRASKGSELTHNELDDNFTNLNTDKIESLADDTTPQLSANLDVQANSITTSTTNGNITLTPNGTGNVGVGTMTFDADQVIGAGHNNYVLTYNHTSGLFRAEAPAMSELVDDTTPTLGGNLDVSTYAIEAQITDADLILKTSALGSGSIYLTPQGTGTVKLGQFNFDTTQTVGVGQDNYVLTYDNTSGLISLEASTGGMSNLVDDTTPELGGDLYYNGHGIVDAAGHEIVEFAAATATTPANYLEFRSGSTGAETHTGECVQIAAKGDDAKVNLYLKTKGFADAGPGVDPYVWIEGNLGLPSFGYIVDSDQYPQWKFYSVATPVNYIESWNAGTGTGPKLKAIGSDTNVDLSLEAKGTGSVTILNSDLAVSTINDLAFPGSDGTTGQVMYTNGAGTLAFKTLTESDISDLGTYLTDIVSDTTPQLGGNLDVQANSITTSTTNGGITLTPNGTGNVTLGNFVFDADQTVGAGQDNYVLTYDNATGLISLEAATGGASLSSLSDTDITAAAKGDILVHNGTNWVDLTVGTNDQILQADSTQATGVKWATVGTGGLGNVSEDTTPQLGGDLDINGYDIVSVANANIDIVPNGTGNIRLGNITLDADQTVGAGQDNYVLTYDNATGLVSLEAAAGGGMSDLVDDTTPQLGGNLDCNGGRISDSTSDYVYVDEKLWIRAATGVNNTTMRIGTPGDTPKIAQVFIDANYYSTNGALKIGVDETGPSAFITAGASIPLTFDSFTRAEFNVPVRCDSGLTMNGTTFVDSYETVNSGTSYNLTSSTNNFVIVDTATAGNAITINLPNPATDNIAIGTTYAFLQAGPYSTDISDGSNGATVNDNGSATALGQGSVIYTTKVSYDVWWVYGETQGSAPTELTGTAEFTAAGHINGIVEMNNASANTYTISPDSTIPSGIGATIKVIQIGAGQTTLVAGTGVTLRSLSSNLKISGQYGVANLVKTAANEWTVYGDLSA